MEGMTNGSRVSIPPSDEKQKLTLKSKQSHVQKFEIQLSNVDSDRLASNCGLFAEYVSAAILDGDGVPSENPA
jgi:hypothetical protein